MQLDVETASAALGWEHRNGQEDAEFVSNHLEIGLGKKRFYTAKELASLESSDLSWVLRPWVVHGAITELAGKVKLSGKTTFATHLCRAKVFGLPFLEEAVSAGAVVYLTEQSSSTFRVALDRAGLLTCEDFHLLLRTENLDLSWPELITLAANKCTETEAGLLVIDTLGPFAGVVDENSATEAQAAMTPLSEAVQKYGLGVLITRHSRKGGGVVSESGRGSSAYAGAVDLMIDLDRRSGNYPKSQRILSTVGRFDEPPDELVIELREEGYVSLGSPDDAGRDELRSEVFALLQGGDSLDPKAIIDAIAAERGEDAPPVSPTTLSRVLTEEFERGSVGRLGRGVRNDPYRYALSEFVSNQPTLLGGEKGIALP